MIFEVSSQKGRKGLEEQLKKSKENMNARLRDAINVMALRVLSSNTLNLNTLNSTIPEVKKINLMNNMKINRWTDHFTFQHFLFNLFFNITLHYTDFSMKNVTFYSSEKSASNCHHGFRRASRITKTPSFPVHEK